jgi:hypothetical protein
VFWQDQEADKAEYQDLRRTTLDELARVNAQLDMFEVPLWGYFKDALEEVERVSIDALVTGSAEAVGASERIKLARHLAKTQERLESERARLEGILRNLDEEE